MIRKNRNNGEALIKKYIVLEIAPNRELADYIIYAKSGLGEYKSKAIFFKIVKAIQSIHQRGICHRDIKLENILLDGDFNPKIADFGYASKNAEDLNDYLGTESFAAPEILLNKPYDGFKADVFSLGATLIVLTFDIMGFKKASLKNKLYKKIINEEKDDYWEVIYSIVSEEISNEFKDLFIKMVAFNPENRPSIQQVLDHDWLKTYREMNDEQKKKLDDELKNEFLIRVNKIKDSITEEIEESNIESLNLNIRSAHEEDKYFKEGLKPKKVPEGFDMSFCFKIKGSVDPCKFMNHLCNKIISKFGTDNCYIEANKKRLKLIVTFEGDEGEEEEEENNNSNIKGNDISIKIKLYESKNGLLLKLFKVKGNKNNFYEKFTAIAKLVKNIN